MNLKIKRLDHHGIVAGVIEDLPIVSLLDRYLPQDEKQEISPEEAVKGMIVEFYPKYSLHSWGRPCSEFGVRCLNRKLLHPTQQVDNVIYTRNRYDITRYADNI